MSRDVENDFKPAQCTYVWADSYKGTKNLKENRPNPFFSIKMGTRLVQRNPFESFVTRLLTGSETDSFAQAIQGLDAFRFFLNAANVFRTRCNWPITLLELKCIVTGTSARNAAATAKGMVELRLIVFYSREERGRWRQGPRCLRCLKLRRIGGLAGELLEDEDHSLKVKWMR